MKTTFFLFAKGKEQFTFDNQSLGIGDDRAVYYVNGSNKSRLYRGGYDPEYNIDPDNENFILKTFSDKDEAQQACDNVNEIYNDDFVVKEIEAE